MLDPGFPLVAEALALCLTLKINAETFTYVTKILISQLLLGSLNRKMGLHLFFFMKLEEAERKCNHAVATGS